MNAQSVNTQLKNTQPVLFVSHGSPMLALDAGAVGAAWRRVANALEKPAAVLLISAHWETALPTLTGASQLSTIHDFGGFPAALYQMQYPAIGAPQLADRVENLLRAAGMPAAIDTQRGLDHGAWVPLREMYPAAAIPVVQLSLQTELGPRHHFQLGRILAPLARENILIIGSGSITHNLRDGMLAARGDHTALSYVPEFQQWVYQTLQAGDVESLLAYRSVARYGVRSHPTEEHFLPLFVALGAAGEGAQIAREYDSIAEGILGMDVYRFVPRTMP